jgi:UDP-glucose 4-epimerase
LLNANRTIGRPDKLQAYCGSADVGVAALSSAGERGAGDPELVANSDKLQSTLGWTPKYTDIRDIVRTAWDFHREHTRKKR